MKKMINAKSFKKFIRDLSLKKSFRISAFFIGIIAVIFGGVTICKLIFDTNPGDYWDGTIATSFHSGSGTLEDPYTITNGAELAYLQSGCTNGVYVQLSNDIYLNPGYIEYENNEYKISIGDNVYSINPSTGDYYDGTTLKGQLVNYVSTENATECSIDGNNHKIFGLYINSNTNASFFNNYTGTIKNLYVQSGLINGITATFINNISDSSLNSVYFDAVLSSSGVPENFTPINLYNQIQSESLGSSSTIDFNVSSEYAEANYTASSGKAYQAGVYQFASDTSVYFYRGSVTNNNVLFAGFCWKIIRTTETGGIRMIYNGVPSNGSCNATGSDTTIGTSKYNSKTNRSRYVGYTYDNTNQNSSIKTTIDNWYSTYLTNYTNYLEDSPYCNDMRTMNYSSDSIGTTTSSGTWYQGAGRVSETAIIVDPDLSCGEESTTTNLYTVSSSNGNGKLTYPVGLITSDELVLAGATSNYTASGTTKDSSKANNTTYYLYTGSSYWTMTPHRYQSSVAYVDQVSTSSRASSSNVNTSSGVRPVITLTNYTFIIRGDGTANNPYIITEPEQAEETNLLEHVIDSQASDSNLVMDTETSGVVNYRYIGTSPSNYVCLGGTTSNCSDGELYRMLGVYNSDTHGQTGKQLIKAVRANPFDTKIDFDKKGNNVGSHGNTSYLSPEWSDAQLMYILNGTHYVNSGYKIGSSTPLYNWTNTNGQISDGTTTFYIVNGSYYDGGGSVNNANSVNSGSIYSPSTITIPGLNDAGRELVQEANWHTSQISWDASSTSAATVYAREIGANQITNRADYWIGKIGLISTTDFIYATSGGSGGRTRNQCLTIGLSDTYSDGAYTNEGYECDNKNWLNANHDYNYYFITQSEGYWDTYDGEYVFGWDFIDYGFFLGGEYWYVAGVNWKDYDYSVRPALYLKDNVIYTLGDGTQSSPYLLAMPSNDPGISVQVGYAAFIGNSSNTEYDSVKIEGTMLSESSANGLIYSSSGDTISEFQITSSIIADEANLFIGNTSGSTQVSNGYYSGYLNSAAININNDSGITYTNVYVYGDSGYSINNECAQASDTNKVLQSIDSSNTCYRSKSTIQDSMNAGLNPSYWNIDLSTIPQLLMSEDRTNPYVSLCVVDIDNDGRTYCYDSSIPVIDTTQIKNTFRLEVNSLTDNTAIKSIEYLIANNEVTNLGSQTFTHLTGDITITERSIYVIYLKVTDISNNVTYINTDYIVNVGYDNFKINGTSSSVLNIGAAVNKKNNIIDINTPNGTIPFGTDSLYIKVTSIPAGTIISFFKDSALYQYTATGTESYIPLTSFKKTGSNTNTYFSGTLDTVQLHYDFSNTTGGQLNTELVMRMNGVDIVRTPDRVRPNVYNSIGSITLNSNISSAIPLGTVGSTNITYTLTDNIQSGYYQLKLYVLDNQNNVVSTGPSTGLSVTYNSKKYYADQEGYINVPIGNYTSSIPISLNVEHLNNILPSGTYRLVAIVSNGLVSSLTNTINASINYISPELIDKLLIINENDSSKVLNRDTNQTTLSFNIKTVLNNTMYSSTNVVTKVLLEKKETLSSNNYTVVNINNYLSSSSQLSNGNNNLFPINSGVTGNSNNTYNLTFNKNNITPGAYRLLVKVYANGSEVKSKYIYFIVK